MADNEKLARWQGWKPHPDGASVYSGKLKIVGGKRPLPDYLNDDAAAMSLLDTLVEKGYCPLLGLNGTTELWQCSIDEFFMRGRIKLCSPVVDNVELGRPTRREAVVAACLELIEKEANNASS